jgi:hypothetical protein
MVNNWVKNYVFSYLFTKDWDKEKTLKTNTPKL